MLPLIEVLSGLLLLGCAFLPSQNYEQLIRLFCGALFLLLPAWFLGRRRSLLSTGLFFHFAVIAFWCLRSTMAHGQLTPWFLWESLVQWAIVLWLTLKFPDSPAVPSIFLVICFISPLHFLILRAWDVTFPGLPIWLLLTIRGAWLTRRPDAQLHGAILLFLVLCAVSIPFSLYPFRNVQFFLLITGCVLTYYSISSIPAGERWVVLYGTLCLALTLVAFAAFKTLFLLWAVGPTALGTRLTIVLEHNDIAPQFLLLSSILLSFFFRGRSLVLRTLLAITLALLGVLLFLTYSRNAWLNYLLFGGVFAALHFRREAAARFFRRAGAAFVVLALPLLLNPTVRDMVAHRVQDSSSVEARLVSWTTGLKSISQHPLFGVGWLNYYAHASLQTAQPPLQNLTWNQVVVPAQAHSVFLDLAEAGGIPLSVVFLVILFIHLRVGSRDAALLAGLAAVTLNSAFDGAAFFTTNFPHLWILMALLSPLENARPAVRIPARAVPWLSVPLLVVASLLLAEDRAIQESSFYYRNHQGTQAIEKAKLARKCMPVDVSPLSQLKEIYLSQMDFSNARQTLDELNRIEKDFAPYYAQLGRVELVERNYKESLKHLQTAEKLDPCTALKGGTYLLLAELYHRLNDRPAFEKNLNLAFLFDQGEQTGFETISLLESVDEDRFYQNVTAFAAQNAPAWRDWLSAMQNLYLNLVYARKAALANRVLEETLKNHKLPWWEVDNLCELLSSRIFTSGAEPAETVNGIRALLPYASPDEKKLLRARIAILQQRFPSAWDDLNSALGYYRYHEMADLWEAFYVQTNQLDTLERHYEIMEMLSPVRLGGVFRKEKADLLMTEGKYAEAAREYHRLSEYYYDDPQPHWMEARMWWQAAETEKAREANQRLQHLIPSNWFTANLYRSYIRIPITQGVGVSRVILQNELGGFDWRVGIYEHPPQTIAFPTDRKFSRISGELALVWGAWFEQTDGVEYRIMNDRGDALFQYVLDPRSNQQQRRWNPFVWVSTGGPQSIVLNTLPRGDKFNDWAFWTIEPDQEW